MFPCKFSHRAKIKCVFKATHENGMLKIMVSDVKKEIEMQAGVGGDTAWLNKVSPYSMPWC